MSAADLALVVVTVVALVAVGVLAVVMVQLRALVTELREATEEFAAVAQPAAEELTSATDRAAEQVDRLDDLIATTSSVAGTVDTATAATVRALSNPVIRTAAIAKGTRLAARRLGGTGDTGGKSS